MTDTLERETRETLYVTDAEIIRRSGVPEKILRPLLIHWDASPGKSGFPQKIKLFGNRRCWPKVKTYLETLPERIIEAHRKGGAR